MTTINTLIPDLQLPTKIIDNFEVPVLANLEEQILEMINKAPDRFRMDSWHDFISAGDVRAAEGVVKPEQYNSCGTTHCMAGWAVALTGAQGAALEAKTGPEEAGQLLFRAAYGYWPDFFADADEAKEALEARCSLRADGVTITEDLAHEDDAVGFLRFAGDDD